MKSSWALCCSKVNVRRSTEPICDLRIAKFSHASQFLRLVTEPTSSGLEAVGLTYKNFFSKLNIVIFSPLHLHWNKNKSLNRIEKLPAKINKFLQPALLRALFCRINVNQLTRNFISAYNVRRKNELKTSWLKKRVQMVREYLNVIIFISLGILILQLYHLLLLCLIIK